MLKIRLTRMGAKKNPFYRVVVIDSKEARNGTPVATVGWYDPAKAGLIWVQRTRRRRSICQTIRGSVKSAIMYCLTVRRLSNRRI